MLKNASSLAIVGLDTAENGPSKVRQVTNRIDAIIGPTKPGNKDAQSNRVRRLTFHLNKQRRKSVAPGEESQTGPEPIARSCDESYS